MANDTTKSLYKNAKTFYQGCVLIKIFVFFAFQILFTYAQAIEKCIAFSNLLSWLIYTKLKSYLSDHLWIMGNY